MHWFQHAAFIFLVYMQGPAAATSSPTSSLLPLLLDPISAARSVGGQLAQVCVCMCVHVLVVVVVVWPGVRAQVCERQHS
jgi:hypothetical protein